MEEDIEKRKKKLKDKFFSWVNDNYDKLFIVILIAAFVIRLIIFLKTMNQPLWYDEASYLLAGKKWGLGLDIKDLWYYRRGFLFPLICTLFFKLGLGEVSIRFFDILLSVGFVFVSYFIIRDMFNKKIALLSCIGLTLSWILLFFTGRILTDIPAAFFILLSLFFFWKGYILKRGNKFIYLFALFFALAVLIRMQSFMLAPPFLIMMFIREKSKMFKNRSLWIALGIFALIMLPQVVLYSMHYGNPIPDILSHYLGVGAKAAGTGDQRTISLAIFNYFTDLPYMMSTIMLILLIIGAGYFLLDLILGFDQIFKNEELQKKFFVFCWILSLFLIMGYIGSVSYVEQRYITVGLPFLFLLSSIPLIKLSEFFTKKFKIKEISAVIMVSIILVVFLVANIFGPSNFNTTFSLLENKKTSYLEIEQAGLWLKENSNPKDIIISSSPTQIMYYSERTVYTIPELGRNESDFQRNLTVIKPSYFMVSLFEQEDPWILQRGNTQDGKGFISLPYLNSTIIFDSTGGILNMDLKPQIKKGNAIFTYVYPTDKLNGVFLYRVNYS